MTNEHTNRAIKAIAIASALRTAGCDAETAENLDDAGWQLAAKVAAANTDGATWTDASWETRSIVIAILGGVSENIVTEALATNDELAGRQATADVPVVHCQTGSSTVRCGATMRHWRDNPTGWDLGTVTVDPGGVTCPDCLPASALTVRAVQSSGGARPGRTDDERALAAAVDQAIARQHPTERECPNCGDPSCPNYDCGARDADDINYDAFLNWCEEHGHNPDAGTSIVMYADHLDASEREAMRP